MDINIRIIIGIVSLVVAVLAISLLTAFIADEPIRENPIIPINVDTSDIENIEDIIENPTKNFEEVISNTQNPFTEVILTSSDKQRLLQSEALYEVIFTSKWSKNTNPNFIPDRANLSPFVVWTHTRKDVLFSTGEIASEAIEQIAETGGTSKIEEEIKEAKDFGIIFDSTIGKLITAPGRDSSLIKASTGAKYITAISAITSSPDWFLSARNIELFKNNSWVLHLDVDATLYDAGTDSEVTFDSEDLDTIPQEFIHNFPGAPRNPIGKFTFVRIK